VLNIPIGGEGDDYFWADELFVSSKESYAAQGTTTGRIHLAFQAKDRETVERFYAAAIAAGGKDNGKPGLRPYHPQYYGAFVIDPDGNNIEAVFHGPAEKSADAVKVTYEAWRSLRYISRYRRLNLRRQVRKLQADDEAFVRRRVDAVRGVCDRIDGMNRAVAHTQGKTHRASAHRR